MFNLTSTHQGAANGGYKKFGQTLSPDEKADRSQVRVPRWLPDTPMVRDFVGRTYDNLAWTGKQIGGMLEELEEAGVADDTVVIFFADHGDGALPRVKEFIYDSGTRVPFIIRAGRNVQVPGLGTPGETNDRLCNFVDVPPSILSLLGMPIPEHMQGAPFLGQVGPKHDYIVATRDRANT